MHGGDGSGSRCSVSAMLLGGCAVFAMSQVPVKRDGNVLVDADGDDALHLRPRHVLEAARATRSARRTGRRSSRRGDAKPVGDYTIIARDDGRRQWAYKGKPLYVWSKDGKPGDQSGEAFDNVWRVARP